MLRLYVALMTILFALPGVTMADPSQKPPPPQYAKFLLSAVDLDQMSDDRDKECLEQAQRYRNMHPAASTCQRLQLIRFETHIRFAYSAALVRLPIEKRAALQRDQRAWLVHGMDACEELPGRTEGYGDLVYLSPYSTCKVTEFYRRSVWLQRIQ